MVKVHLSLAVQDVSATSAFYETLFQSRPIKTKVDYVKFEPADLALNISFTARTMLPLRAGPPWDPNRV